MPTFISNLPVHVLVVHAVVMLVPLAVLGAVTVALWPAARRRYGWLVVGIAALATAAVPIATNTGEGLERNLPGSALIQAHAHLGDELLVYVAGMLVLLTGFLIVHQRARATVHHDGPGTVAAPRATTALRGPLRIVAGVLAALTVVLAVVSGVQVYRIGDSGARAAWADRQYVAPTGGPGAGDGG